MAPTRGRIVAAAMLGVSMALTVAGCSTADNDASGSPSGTSSSAPVSPPRQNRDLTYADGDYTAKGWYGGGPSSIDVAVTLADDEITAVKVTPNATNPTSLDYQQRFAEAVSALVVGKDIDEVNLDRVAGSSSTPDGFNDALNKIKAQARN